MKYLIETYKNQDIHYNDDSDKFECTIEMGEALKSTKRQSLNDVRNEIDQFVKANLNFKPFKAITAEYSDIRVVDVKSIRKDGKYVTNRGYSDSYTPKKEIETYKQYDEAIFSEYQRLQKEVEYLNKLNRDKIKELIAQLKPIII